MDELNTTDVILQKSGFGEFKSTYMFPVMLFCSRGNKSWTSIPCCKKYILESYRSMAKFAYLISLT